MIIKFDLIVTLKDKLKLVCQNVNAISFQEK